MELHDYVNIFRKRVWLLLLAGLAGSVIVYVLSSSRPRLYTASVKVSVGKYLQIADPGTEDIRSAQELAETYAVLAKTRGVLQDAISATEADLAPEELIERVETEILPQTALLQISVDEENPMLSAELANEIANQLIVHYPGSLTPEQQDQLNQANLTIADLDRQIQDAQEWLKDIENVLSEGAEPLSTDLQWLITQRNVIIDHIARLTESRTQYFTIATRLEERKDELRIVEEARVPTHPTNLNTLVLAGFGFLGGIAVASIGILLVDYFDKTIRGPQQVVDMMALPVLAQIPHFGKRSDNSERSLETITAVGDLPFEHYRMLRTALLHDYTRRDSDSSKTIYLIASPGTGEGKSTTIANLGAVLAVGGTRVLLIDADLRHPVLHTLFNLKQSIGLASMLSTAPPEPGGSSDSNGCGSCVNSYIQDTKIPGLQVMTSGDPVGHPAELFCSQHLVEWFSLLKASTIAHIVLIDTPPALLVPDASILASNLDAPVLLVLRSGHTTVQTALEIKRQFDQLNLAVEGVIFNGVQVQDLGGRRDKYYRYH